MSTPSIRPAEAADATPACAVLRRSIAELCAVDHRNDPAQLAAWLSNKTPANIAAWIDNPDNVVLVAVIEDRIAGVAAMTHAGVVTLNYVSPDARFQGVSKALLGGLEAKAVGLGLTQCRLASTLTARRFYEAAGYRAQPGATPGGGIPMVKDLG